MLKRLFACVVTLALSIGSHAVADDDSLSLVVMDPLAAPLSCPCVEGYAQRKYEVLASHLETSIGRKVKLTFSESLKAALEKTDGHVDIVIGKQSVVAADLAAAKRKGRAVFRLTDQKGSTEQYGMIVVNKDDPAKNVKDLAGYTIIFGPSEAEEKSSAAFSILKNAGITIPTDRRKVDEACSDGACKVIDLGPKSKTAAVISSYAQPLLEGCGTIKKGDLRVVVKTDPVPFITVFATDSVNKAEYKMISESLAEVSSKPAVLESLESLVGFVQIADAKAAKKK